MDIRALTFDTGGTILDWHTGIARALEDLGKRRGVEADWPALTNEYRMRSLLRMTGGDADFRPDFNIDDVHREEIENLARERALAAFTSDDFDAVRDAWHELACWPDVPDGLTRLRKRHPVVSLTILSVRLIVDTARRNGLVWDAVLSCETIGIYKPRPRAYLAAAEWLQLGPGECLMVAAHKVDLKAAAAAGFRTAYVERPTEWGAVPSPDRTVFEADLTASDFGDLADQLGC